MSNKAKATTRSEDDKPALMPKFRFPEFGDASWKKEPLRDLAILTTERAGDKECILMSITSGVGLVSQMEKFGRTIAGNQFRNYITLRKNEFAYNKSATKDYPQGFIAMYSGDELAAVPNSIFTCFRVRSEKVVPKYLDYLFLGNLHGKWLKKYIEVSARAHGSLSVDDEDLLSLPVPLPSGEKSRAEQQKIAECLTTLDEVVAAQSQKLDALRTHKKGLMQQLFPRKGETTPRLRFPEFHGAPEWEEKKLGDFSDVKASGDLDPKCFSPTQNGEFLYPVYSNGVENDGLYGYYAIPQYPSNSLTITARGTLGIAFAREQDFMGIGRLLVVNNLKEVNLNFLKECWNHLANIPQEVTSIPQLTAITARATALLFPKVSEQERISSCLSSLNKLITAQNEKLEALKTHKKGLMQQVFPTSEEIEK